MRSGNVIDFEMIKADKLEHIREANKNLPIDAVNEVPVIEELKGNGVIVNPEILPVETEAKKRRFSIRSKVQSIRDDLYENGERVASIEFCYIPAGIFRMGRFGNFHRVTVNKSFYLGKYPVTQELWKAVTGNNPSDFKGEKFPVEQVSWEDCQEFIKRLNEQTGQNKYRLPTEAEWEYACRAGSNTHYSFGDERKKLNEYGWFYGNSGGKSHPVGQKLPNSWGLHDMHGGVWEWCEDWYATYPRWKAIDPAGPSSGTDRVLRGGSWFDGPKRCRSSFRSYFSPDFRCNFFGFRLARKA